MSIPGSPPPSGAALPPESARGLLIVGATSAIAVEVARAYAPTGARFILVGRNPARLDAVADDLRVRGAAQAAIMELDVADLDRHGAVIEAAAAALGTVDVALIAHGVLPDQRRSERDVALTLDAVRVNLTATVSLLTLLAQRLESQRHGCLAVITSVAGDRGRRSNYLYGATKAGLDVFLQGLRARLKRVGVMVLTIKPGLVDTPMTAAIPKHRLFVSPQRVGRAVRRAIEARKSVVYVPGFWRPIMALLRAMPERLFIRFDL